MRNPLAKDLLRQLTEAMVTRSQASITFEAEGTCALPPATHVVIYRIAQEALNNAAAVDADLLVILNDNDMSIAEPVGAFNNYLARLLSGTERKLNFHRSETPPADPAG